MGLDSVEPSDVPVGFQNQLRSSKVFSMNVDSLIGSK